MGFQVKRFITYLLFLFSVNAYSQSIALAVPVQNIELDGSFVDWPETMYWNSINNYYGSGEQSNEDFQARFSTGYDLDEGSLYIALQVLDDEFVGKNGNNHSTQDHMLLYLDLGHRMSGGSPVFYVGSDEVLEIHHKPGNYDETNHELTLENAELKRKRLGNLLQYEWKISVKKELVPHRVLGVDFMIIDHDVSEDSEDILLWKNGFGKSFGSQNLGDLVLLEKGEQLSRVQGHVQMETLQKQEKIDALNIVSLANSSFWVEAFVDSTGYFQALLPSGTYRVQPNRFYTSPFKSAGFKQNTRRIEYSFMNNFEVVKDSITNLDTITFKVIPRPEKTLSSSILPIEHLTPDDIDNFVTTWKDYFDIPAVSVVLIRDNKVFYDKTMGLKNNLTRELANSNTLFEAASISKAVFGVMVLRLAERGIIDLDKPLYQYLPFPNIKDDQRSKLLTARLILGHQSGLPNWAWGGPGTWEGGGDIELNFEPGSDFGYSGEAFNYLGRVVEHITQKKLQTIYEEEIEGPFGVKDSYFYYTDDQEERFALGHLHQYIQIKGQERIASPASSVSTNAHLFQDFVLGLMNEKNMSAESYGLIYEPYTVLSKEQKLYDPEFSQHVSHGFFVQIRDDGMLIGHGGNNGDYDSKFAYNPQKKYAYIVFTNSNLGDEFIRALEEFLLTKH